MKTLIKALGATALAAAVALPVLAAETAEEKAIKARQSLMTLYSWNLGTLGAMAKEAIPYDALAAAQAANNLAALAGMNAGSLWPAGSDSTAMPGKTRAKKEAWDTFPEILAKHEVMQKASMELAAVAGNGLDALKGAIGPVGKGCGGCHENFREEKK